VGRKGAITLNRIEQKGAVYYLGDGPASYTHFKTSGSTGGCSIATTGTRAGSFGFVFVVQDPSNVVAPLSGMATPGPTLGAELFDLICDGTRMPSQLNGFATGLLMLYEPLPPGTIPLRTKRAITAWTTEAPGVLSATVSRQVTTNFAPTKETSTFRLHFLP
jgi:hypothetical protein